MEKEYLHNMLRLSGLSEAYLDPAQNKIWETAINKYKASIQGSISEVSQAVESALGWAPKLEIPVGESEDFASNVIKYLEKMKSNIEQHAFRNKDVDPGTKFHYIGKAFGSLKEVLKNFHDMVLKKEQFLQSQDLKKELENYYRQHVEPLLKYTSELTGHSYNVNRKF